MVSSIDVAEVRPRFPALALTTNGVPAAYLDGPGGTQVPAQVIEAMAGYLGSGGSNLGGPFVTSDVSARIVEDARTAVAALFGATAGEIVFGQNMTTLTFAVSRSLGATWQRGDNVVVTRLDHDANVWPWVLAAREAGAEVRWVDFDPDRGCRLDLETMEALIDDRTRLLAVTHASNAVGTVVDVRAATEIAHARKALVYVDAVHYSPHRQVSVGDIGCDFLVASSYKFFGPHLGCLYGRRDLLESLTPLPGQAGAGCGARQVGDGNAQFRELGRRLCMRVVSGVARQWYRQATSDHFCHGADRRLRGGVERAVSRRGR